MGTELSSSMQSDADDLEKSWYAMHRGTIEKAVAFGHKCRALQDKYANYKTGSFGVVLRTAGIPRSSAYAAISLVNSRFPDSGQIKITQEAVLLLTGPKSPEAAEEEAFKLASEGEKITKAVAAKIIKKHSEPKEERPKKAPGPDDWLVPFQSPYETALSHLNEILRTLGKLAEEEETGVWLHEAWPRIRKSLSDGKTAISQVQPWTTCPDCKGKRCEKCRNSGMLTKFAYGNLPMEMRA